MGNAPDVSPAPIEARPRSGRRVGRPSRISRADIVNAATAICAEDGFAATTVTAVAQRLGVAPASLYHHVTDLDDLRAGVIDQVIGETTVPPEPEPGGEREWLMAVALATRTVLLRYPGLSHYLTLMGPSGPVSVGVLLRIYRVLAQAGVPQAEVAAAHSLIFGGVATHVTRQHHAAAALAAGEKPYAAFFEAMDEQGGVPGYPESEIDLSDFERGFAWMMPRLLKAILD